MTYYHRQYIVMGAGPQTVAAHLNEYVAQNPKHRLVTVILKPRNPGQPDVYEAIWEERS